MMNVLVSTNFMENRSVSKCKLVEKAYFNEVCLFGNSGLFWLVLNGASTKV